MATMRVFARAGQRAGQADRASRAGRFEVVWLVAAVWFTLPLIAGMGRRFDDLATPCRQACESRGLGVLRPDQMAALQDLGISPPAYAALDVGREAALAVACMVVGTTMVRRVGSPAAWLAAAALLATSTILVPEITTSALENGHPLVTIAVASAFPFTASVFFFLLPDGRWQPSWARWVVGAWAAVSCAWAAASWHELAGLVELQFVTLVVLVPLGLAAQVARVRRAPAGPGRQQAKWVLLGTLAWVASLVVYLTVVESGLLPREAGGVIHPLAYLVYGTALTAMVTILPISWAFAVLRYRLWDVDRIVGRTSLAVMVTVAAVTLFGLVTATLALAVRTRWERATPIAAILSVTTFVAVQPRVRAAIERWLFGERGDPYDLMARLWSIAHAGEASVDRLDALLRRLSEDLHLTGCRLVLTSDLGTLADLRVGSPEHEPDRITLATGAHRIGTLVVWPRTGEDRLSRRDRDLVENVAAPIVHVAAMVHTTEDLRRSRAEVVVAREDERRALQHDLHDDLGPTIAVQAMLIDAASDAMDHDPGRARELLALAQARNEHLVSEVRRLATDLHPLALERRGLAGALRQFATDGGRSGPAVTVTVSLAFPIPAAVAATVYRVASEALANAVRHARATTIAIEAASDEEQLTLTVTDDGRGIPTRGATGRGTGLASMGQRAREIGASLAITSPPSGGTTVTLRVSFP